MPVYTLYRPHCDRTFQGLVFAGTRVPEKWVCSQCACDDAYRLSGDSQHHPLESTHARACPCCGGTPDISINRDDKA